VARLDELALKRESYNATIERLLDFKANVVAPHLLLAGVGVLREFIQDVEALSIMTIGDQAHRDAVDWPDLWVTYQKARALIVDSDAGIERREPDRERWQGEAARILQESGRSEKMDTGAVLELLQDIAAPSVQPPTPEREGAHGIEDNQT
jgi:hypothetical protein